MTVLFYALSVGGVFALLTWGIVDELRDRREVRKFVRDLDSWDE